MIIENVRVLAEAKGSASSDLSEKFDALFPT